MRKPQSSSGYQLLMGHHAQGKTFPVGHAAIDIVVIKKGQAPLAVGIVGDPPGLSESRSKIFLIQISAGMDGV